MVSNLGAKRIVGECCVVLLLGDDGEPARAGVVLSVKVSPRKVARLKDYLHLLAINEELGVVEVAVDLEVVFDLDDGLDGGDVRGVDLLVGVGRLGGKASPRLSELVRG